MAVLLSCCATTNTLFWLGEEVLSHQKRPKQNPQGAEKAEFQQKWGIVAFLWVFSLPQ